MKRKTIFQDLGTIEYQKAWDFQEKLFNEIIELKTQNRELPGCEQLEKYNHLLFCEHPHVYTLGKSGSEDNLLVNYIQLQAKDATFVRTNRGGDITYHGPGQIVGYPIIDLEDFDLGIKSYIHKMEEAIIEMLKEYGIQSDRMDGATGVWIDKDIPGKARKISAIGVRTSRFVSMHGFALNINTDLDYFNHINPCGFTDKGVTSLEKELGERQDINKAQDILRAKFEKIFGMNFIKL
ncbi:MAG: lipoyl(octanoyl) transferase LipB [Bacteroidales bacterium]|nr:lipoyl(octanoyl) transferase LipB [Bacteroidales bacterium]